MSMITEVILLAYPTSPEEQREITSHNFETRDGRPFGQYLTMHDSNHAGGTKFASWKVFHAAFNYVAESEVTDWFEAFAFDHQTVGLVMIVDSDSSDIPTLHSRIPD